VSVTATTNGSVCVLVVDGEFTGPNVKRFRELVRQAVDGEGNDFVVDFANVTGIDSEALEALTCLKREREEDLGMVKLCHQSDVMKKIFEMTRLNRQFEAFDHLDDALKSFG